MGTSSDLASLHLQLGLSLLLFHSTMSPLHWRLDLEPYECPASTLPLN